MTAATEMNAPVDATMLPLKVCRKIEIAQEIFQFELERDDQRDLPPFTAGAHVVVVTPNGLTRRYSLCNSPAERDRYVIAIKRDAQGYGGSVSLVDVVKVGDMLSVSPPENYFPLADSARRCVLIAGGIGITPILSMMHALVARKVDVKLIYFARSPETTAFLEELSAPQWAGRVLIHHNHGDRDRSLDLPALLADWVDGTHLYCCGPRSLMQDVREGARHWPSDTVHFEDFGTSVQPKQVGGNREFLVRLARQEITVTVQAGMSILEALRSSGITVPSSCESGTCGSCRTGLISGVAEHRDFVLDEDDHDKEIMICVSRSRCAQLVLDL